MDSDASRMRAALGDIVPEYRATRSQRVISVINQSEPAEKPDDVRPGLRTVPN
jgi:hypothetical protein